MSTSGERPYRIQSAASFGAAIRHYRIQAGLTQAELADRSGISRGYLSNLEGGGQTEQLRRILAVLAELGIVASLERTGR